LFGHGHHLACSLQHAQHDGGSFKGLGGRKRRDGTWVYFKNNPTNNKTEYIVMGDGGKCGHKVGGKNATNLKGELRYF